MSTNWTTSEGLEVLGVWRKNVNSKRAFKLAKVTPNKSEPYRKGFATGFSLGLSCEKWVVHYRTRLARLGCSKLLMTSHEACTPPLFLVSGAVSIPPS